MEYLAPALLVGTFLAVGVYLFLSRTKPKIGSMSNYEPAYRKIQNHPGYVKLEPDDPLPEEQLYRRNYETGDYEPLAEGEKPKLPRSSPRWTDDE